MLVVTPATASVAVKFRTQSAERWRMLREAARDPRTIGSITPSSSATARALTAPLRARPGSLTILEVGAGTGAVTRAVLAEMTPGCRLDVVESNLRLAARLDAAVGTGSLMSRQVSVQGTSIDHLDTGRRYDVIISTLPFANFPPDRVDAIMTKYMQLLHPLGTLTYIAYLGSRQVHTLLAGPAGAHAVDDVLAEYRKRCGAQSVTVWGNVPPTRVWRLTRPGVWDNTFRGLPTRVIANNESQDTL
jgi:phosphatidylethanolamine/phosphatidyl-N-methylethanolamine N-methyltransferase